MNEPGDPPSENSVAPSAVTECGDTMFTEGDVVNAESIAEIRPDTKAIVTEDLTCPETIDLDKQDVLSSEKMLVVISYISSETGTWVTDTSKSDELRNIMEGMASLQISKLEEPQVGDICGVKDSVDGKWYRAKVIAVNPEILVQFLDFGNQATSTVENLVRLPDKLKQDPLAKRVHLIWPNSPSSENMASVGDLLEVKYNGEEADGSGRLEVISVKALSDADEADLDDELSTREATETDEAVSEEEMAKERIVPSLCSNNGSTTSEEPRESSSHDGYELGTESGSEGPSGAASSQLSDASAHGNIGESVVSADQLSEAEAASNLRAEAHATVKEILKELEEKLPAQDEGAQVARREVEEAMKQLDRQLPAQQDSAVQANFEKMMELFDERLKKQHEISLKSMRNMMEKTLSESLRKIDRIQRDLHQLYERTSANSGKQSRRDLPESQQAVDADAYHRNQYNRQPHRNFGPSTSDFPADRAAHQPKFDHFGSKRGEPRVMSASLAMRQSGGPPGKDSNYHPGKNNAFGASDPNHSLGISHFKPSQEDQGGQTNVAPEKRSVSFRLQQARGVAEGGDLKMNNSSFAPSATAATSNIISVVNLPEAVDIDFLCTLFGLYGNVVRAKVLFQQKGRALVEMADSQQTDATISMLNGTQLFGCTLYLRQCTFEKLSINPLELTNNTAKDYTKLNFSQLNSMRRFKKGIYDPTRFIPPSDTLRVNNIHKSVPDDDVKAAFAKKGFVVKHIFFFQGRGESDKKVAVVTLESVDEAAKALHALHNVELCDWMPMKISFGKAKRQM